jgi:hypothetical protein
LIQRLASMGAGITRARRSLEANHDGDGEQ